MHVYPLSASQCHTHTAGLQALDGSSISVLPQTFSVTHLNIWREEPGIEPTPFTLMVDFLPVLATKTNAKPIL